MNRLLLLVALLALAAPAARAQDAPPADTAAAELLRPGDVVRLLIWREPDLSGDFAVDAEGVVIFPMIGPVDVTRESPTSLRNHLLEAFRRNLRNPSIQVTFMRRVTVLGAVRNPGVYPVDPVMSVAEVLALAGGATGQGAPDKVQLLRGGERLETRISQRTRLADSPIRSGDQLYVPERGWLERNTGLVATALSVATSLFIALAL
jgi:polysaccharide export outer membrane protein